MDIESFRRMADTFSAMDGIGEDEEEDVAEALPAEGPRPSKKAAQRNAERQVTMDIESFRRLAHKADLMGGIQEDGEEEGGASPEPFLLTVEPPPGALWVLIGWLHSAWARSVYS